MAKKARADALNSMMYPVMAGMGPGMGAMVMPGMPHMSMMPGMGMMPGAVPHFIGEFFAGCCHVIHLALILYVHDPSKHGCSLTALSSPVHLRPLSLQHSSFRMQHANGVKANPSGMGPLLMPPMHPGMSPQPPGASPGPRPTFPAYQQVPQQHQQHQQQQQQQQPPQSSPMMDPASSSASMMMGMCPRWLTRGPGCKLMHPEEDISLEEIRSRLPKYRVSKPSAPVHLSVSLIKFALQRFCGGAPDLQLGPTPDLQLGLTPGLQLGPTPGLQLGLTPGLQLGPTPDLQLGPTIALPLYYAT
eukprot:Em0020g455a